MTDLRTKVGLFITFNRYAIIWAAIFLALVGLWALVFEAILEEANV